MKSFLRFLLLTLSLAFVAQQAGAQSFSIDFKDSPNTGFDSNLAPKVAPLNSGTTRGQQRQIAFQYALNQLLGRFQLSRTIVIRARFAELSDSTVAQAYPVSKMRDWWSSQSAFVSGVLYPVALANQLAGRDLTTFGFDLEDLDITFDYEVAPRAFYYGLDGKPGTGEVDFVHTAMHEICHCLGFISNADQNGNWANSFFGLGGDPTIWDHFLQSNGVRLRDMTSTQRAAAVVGDRVQFVGPQALLVAASDPIWVHSPPLNGGSFQSGSSMHHFDEAAFNGTLFFSGLFNETRNRALSEMMSPGISSATHSLGPIGWAALQDMGWTLKDNSGPKVRILSPDSGSRKALSECSGDITDGPDASAVGAWKIEGGLLNVSTGKWFDWITQDFSGSSYNGGSHARVFFPEVMPRATGSPRWTFVMPNLSEGSYRVALKGIDQLGREGEWVYRDFTLDRTAPLLTFFASCGRDGIARWA